MRKINNIIIHCSASTFGCEKIINQWHNERGFSSRYSPYEVSTGYHKIILNGIPFPDHHYYPYLDGSVEIGRPLDSDLTLELTEIGAHALGYNSKSIGYCLIGDRKFTVKQLGRLLECLYYDIELFKIPIENVLGHYETPLAFAINKKCPNFKVDFIRQALKDFKI